MADQAEAYEEQNVHEVYQQIAGHFSATRYKVSSPGPVDIISHNSCCCHADEDVRVCFFQPWPIVEQFLQSLPAGSVGLDVGCGNGKNLQVNRDVFIVASDRYVYTSDLPSSTICFLGFGFGLLQP